jgi:hypothetical protein
MQTPSYPSQQRPVSVSPIPCQPLYNPNQIRTPSLSFLPPVSLQHNISATVVRDICPYCNKQSIQQTDIKTPISRQCYICYRIFVLNPKTNYFDEQKIPVLPTPVISSHLDNIHFYKS